MQQEHACLASGSLSVNYIITIHNPLDIKFIANIEYIYISRYKRMYPYVRESTDTNKRIAHSCNNRTVRSNIIQIRI